MDDAIAGVPADEQVVSLDQWMPQAPACAIEQRPRGSLVGLDIARPGSDRSLDRPLARLRFGWYTRESYYTSRCQHQPLDPGLGDLEQALESLPAEERAPYLLALSMKGPSATLDGGALAWFAKAGRCFDWRGERRTYRQIPVADLLCWVPTRPGYQALRVHLPAKVSWLIEEVGLLENEVDSGLLHLPVSRARLEEIAEAFGEADDDRIIRCNLARPHARPERRLPEGRLYAEQQQASTQISARTWTSYGHKKRPSTTRHYVVNLTIATPEGDVDLPKSPLFAGEWSTRGDAWVEKGGRVDDRLQKMGSDLRRLGFKTTPVLGQWENPDASPWTLVAVKLALGHHFGHGAKLEGQSWEIPELVNTDPKQALILHGTITPSRDAAGAWEIGIGVTLGSRELASVGVFEGRTRAPGFGPEEAWAPKAHGNRYVLCEVGGGRWAYVPRAAWRKLMAQIDALRRVPGLLDRPVRLTSIELARLAKEGVKLPGEAGKRQAQIARGIARCEQARPSASAMEIKGLAHPLKPIQAPAVSWLNTLRLAGFGGLLADDRGFGKTVEVIAAIVSYKNEAAKAGRVAPPVLVLMENKELSHWVRHFARFAPGMVVQRHYGADRVSNPGLLASKDVILTTYEVYKRAADMFCALRPEVVFLDEAIALRNPDTHRYAAVGRLRATAVLFPITGTPVGRKIEDLWSLMELAVPGLLGSRQKFINGAMARGIQGLGVDKDGPGGFVEQLRTRLAPFQMRRLKKDYPEHFPEREPVVQFVTLDEKDVAHYEQKRVAALAQFRLTLARGATKALSALRDIESLRRAASDPMRQGALTTKGAYARDLTKELVEEGHRVLVFCHHAEAAAQMASVLSAADLSVAAYVGTPRQREESMELFKKGLAQVLVLTRLGASGLDLPEADTVIINDPWIDPSIIDQMLDRAHRISSTHSKVSFYLLVAAATVEEVGIEVLERLRASASTILDGEADTGGAGRLTIEDMRQMLEISPA